MCGRYRRKSDKQRIADAFEVNAGLDEIDLAPEDDVAPGSVQPVISITPEGERRIELMHWGFKLPNRLLFNTRSENVMTSKFWKERFEQHRCIVPASAFIEWQQVSKGQKKLKYEISVPGRDIIGFAGLWAPWKNPKTEQWEDTFSIFTTDPNAKMQPIHDRQPVILEPRDYEEWLTPTERPPVHLLRVLPAEETELHLVSPVSIEPPCNVPAQGGLFG